MKRLMTTLLALSAVAGIACSDMADSDDDGDGADDSPLTTCPEVVEKNYQCDPQSYQDYMNQWDISIEDQKKQGLNECTKGHFPTIPAFMACMGRSCEHVNSGACGQILDDAGF